MIFEEEVKGRISICCYLHHQFFGEKTLSKRFFPTNSSKFCINSFPSLNGQIELNQTKPFQFPVPVAIPTDSHLTSRIRHWFRCNCFFVSFLPEKFLFSRSLASTKACTINGVPIFFLSVTFFSVYSSGFLSLLITTFCTTVQTSSSFLPLHSEYFPSTRIFFSLNIESERKKLVWFAQYEKNVVFCVLTIINNQ